MDERDKMIEAANEFWTEKTQKWKKKPHPHGLTEWMADFHIEQTTALRTQHEREVGAMRERLRAAEDIIDSVPREWFMSAVERKAREYRAQYPKPYALTTPTNAETHDPLTDEKLSLS